MLGNAMSSVVMQSEPLVAGITMVVVIVLVVLIGLWRFLGVDYFLWFLGIIAILAVGMVIIIFSLSFNTIMSGVVAGIAFVATVVGMLWFTMAYLNSE